MGIVIKGGSTVINGKGRTNMGPTIPMDGLVMIIDPATVPSGSTNITAVSPLTSSTWSSGSRDVYPLVSGRFNGTVALTPPPTGALTSTIQAVNPGTAFRLGTGEGTALVITGSAMTFLRNNIQKDMTAVVWYSGIRPMIQYPALGSNPTVGNYSSIFIQTNQWPPVADPTTWRTPTNGNLLNAAVQGTGVVAGTSMYRTYDDRLTAYPFPQTGSAIGAGTTATYTTNTPAGWGVSSSTDTTMAPQYITASTAYANIPGWYRQTSFAGRSVYSTNDLWNCIAFTVKRTDTAVSHSTYINGSLLGSLNAATSSKVLGSKYGGSISSFPYAIEQNSTSKFVFTTPGIGNTYPISIIPTSSGTPSDTTGLPTTPRSYYFASASTVAGTITNLVNKINNTANLSAFITASVVGTTGIALTGSVNGILSGSTLSYTSSVVASTVLVTLANGAHDTGTGPTGNILAAQDYYNATVLPDTIHIGAINTSLTLGSAIRLGFVGAIGAVYFYNRILSDAELAQIYDNLKSKYGNMRPSNAPTYPYRLSNPIVGSTETPPSSSGIGY